MVGQTIASTLFNKRSKMSRRTMGQLTVRGAGNMVNDALCRFGWEGEDPVVTTILTVDIRSGAIRGSRYETRGNLGSVTFGAKELWPEAEAGFTVTIKFTDLSNIVWPSEGDSRNQSAWIPDEDLDISYKKSDGTAAAAGDGGMGNLALRFTLQPMAVDSFQLFAGLVPFSKAELRTKLGARGLDISTPLASTIAIKLYSVRGKVANGRPVLLLPQEQKDEGLGLGHLPLLEMIGAGTLTFPDHDRLELESVELLCHINPKNNVTLARLEELYSEDGFPAIPTGKIPFKWPAYRGPVDQGTANTGSTGLYNIPVFSSGENIRVLVWKRRLNISLLGDLTLVRGPNFGLEI